MTREATADPREVSVLVPEARAPGFDAAMARLDQALAARAARERKVGLTIAAGQREAAAVIARRHGYELHVDRVEEPGSVWAEFWPITG
jgi:hypothetical protein